MCNDFSAYMAKLPREQLCDSYMLQGRDQLRKYVERLPEPGARSIVSLQLACLQRTFLETYARSEWLGKWAPRVLDVDKTFELDVHVMGAFTDDFSAVTDLFRIGIPVWLVHRLECHVLTKILQIVPALDEHSWNHTLPLRDSLEPLNIAHADPPHPVIYSGLPGSYTRYARINIFMQQQFASSLIGTFGTQEMVTPSAAQMNANSLVLSLATMTSSPVSSVKQAPSTHQRELLDVTSRTWVSPMQKAKKQKRGIYFLVLP